MKFLRPEPAQCRQEHTEDGSVLPASVSAKEVAGERELDGGDIQGLRSSSVEQPSGYLESHHEGRRRASLALFVFALLALLICGNFAIVVWFAWAGKTDFKAVETAFNTSLPVIAGLAGTAAAFYFRDHRRQ
jgi:hypothetical protein